MQDEPGFHRTQSGLPVLAACANFLSLRSSSKRCVTSRMIAAMPCISPASFSGTTVNSTEIVLPSLRSAGTKRRSPGFVPALAGFYGSCEATPMALAKPLGDNEIERLAEHLLARKAEYPLCSRVPETDKSVAIGGDDGIGQRGQHGLADQIRHTHRSVFEERDV